jgi:hypothetical protein
MDIQEQFKKETGYNAVIEDERRYSFGTQYTDWLVKKLKERDEVIKDMRKKIQKILDICEDKDGL